jgi:hypothetical protein
MLHRVSDANDRSGNVVLDGAAGVSAQIDPVVDEAAVAAPPSIRQRLLRTLRSPATVWRAVFVAATAVTIAAALAPLRKRGWPFNHEQISFKYRTDIYAAHLARGDLFPIWSSSDGFGFGTPLPFYYHRVFYYVSGVLSLSGFSPKVTLVLTVAIFLFIGALGMRLLARAAGVTDPLLLVAVPVVYVLSNYVFNDWLIRGAMGELSAMMVVPFLLRWAVILVRDGRVSFSIVPAFVALFFSHNVIALFGLLVCVVAVCVHLRRVPARWRSGDRFGKELLRYAVIVAGLALIFTPYLVVTLAYSHDYDVSVLTSAQYLPTNNFAPFSAYLYDGDFTWLDAKTFGAPMNLQIGYHIVVLSLIALGFYLVRWRLRLGDRERYPVVLFAGISMALYVLLQLPLSAPVYENVRAMQFIQFPWRLLSYITPLGLLLAALFLNDLRLRRRAVGTAVIAATLVVAVIMSPLPLLRDDHASRLSWSAIDRRFVGSDETRLPNDVLIYFGEYLPTLKDAAGNPTPWRDAAHSYYQSKTGVDISSQNAPAIAAGCSVETPATTFEAPSRRYVFDCGAATKAILPLNYSRLHQVYLTRLDGAARQRTKVPISRAPDQLTIEVQLPAGRSAVEVVLPSLGSLIFGG